MNTEEDMIDSKLPNFHRKNSSLSESSIQSNKASENEDYLIIAIFISLFMFELLSCLKLTGRIETPFIIILIPLIIGQVLASYLT